MIWTADEFLKSDCFLDGECRSSLPGLFSKILIFWFPKVLGAGKGMIILQCTILLPVYFLENIIKEIWGVYLRLSRIYIIIYL